MKYQSKSALAYILRNFGKLFYVALPIAILMAFFANPTNEIEFWHLLITGQLTRDNLYRQFNSAFTVLRLREFWWVNIIAFVLLALTVAMLIVKISRHMRMGLMSALPFKRSFGIFATTFLALLCFFGATEIMALLPVGIMYILRDVDSVLTLAIIGVSLSFVVKTLCAWIFTLLILALPLKYSENYHFNVGLAYSVRVMTKLPREVWIITLTYALGRYVVMLCAFFLHPYYLDIVLYSLVYLFVTLYLPAFAYKVYHDVVGGERRDIYQIMFD